MNLPELKIGDLTARHPIVQGGMGIGISLSGLAGAVAKEGGVGIISAAQPGFNEPDFFNSSFKANCRALTKELKKARKIAPEGIIGVNIMSRGYYYDDYVKCAIEGGADLIVSGAGLPWTSPVSWRAPILRSLPSYPRPRRPGCSSMSGQSTITARRIWSSSKAPRPAAIWATPASR